MRDGELLAEGPFVLRGSEAEEREELNPRRAQPNGDRLAEPRSVTTRA